MMAMLQTPAVQAKECVILLHGILGHSMHMKAMEKALGKAGYHTVNIAYPSNKRDLQGLVHYVKRSIDAVKTEQYDAVHFVGWSMGSLLVRGLLHQYEWPNLGKVVFLGPPSQGSELADFLDKMPLFHHIFGPAGKQLQTNQTAIAKLIGTQVDYPLGIIAGNVSLNPIASLILPGENDGRVSVARTRLPGMQDHITIRAEHHFLPFSRKAKRLVLQFLQYGTFDKSI